MIGWGGVVGSISSSRTPSSTAYDETSGPQSLPSSSYVHSGWIASHHQSPLASSRTADSYDALTA